VNLQINVVGFIATITVSQKSNIRGTNKDSLQQLFGLNGGNTMLIAAACGRPCKTDEATLILMEAAWSALQQ
jgi:hypothetical protein